MKNRGQVTPMNPDLSAHHSYVHPLVGCAVVIAVILILVLPRQRIIIPFLTASILIPLDQVSVMGPLHFQMLRWLILASWLRVIVTALTSGVAILGSAWNRLDTLVTLFAVIDAIDYIILWSGSSDAIINRCGTVYTTLGAYFLMRSMIRTEGDVHLAIKILAYLCAIIATLMAYEQITGSNLYSLLGGERAFERASLIVREEGVRRPRAMGCFQHPLLAGTFGAISVPLFAALWVRAPKRRFLATMGFLSATVIVIASASSTPLLAYACGILALAMWPMRMHMRILRWALVGTLVLLQIVMKAPVWALIQRVDLIGGSSGFHRYYLVDQFIRNAGEWWLLGARSTAQWGPDMWDHANQYVAIGVTSGVVPFVVFLAVIVWGFKCMGRLTHSREKTGKALLAWFLGSALFVNVVAFFGISYFDQIALVWWCLLAMISTLSVSAPARARVSPGPPSAVPVIVPTVK
jgi:hypothetical protein